MNAFDDLLKWTFYAAIALAMVLETLAPRRKPVRPTGARWLNAVGLWLVNSYLSRAAMGASAVVAAAEANLGHWGLLNAVSLPAPVSFAAGFILIDLTGYLKHRAYHGLPLLWQFHVVHHSDADMDVGTGLRHHPVDYVLDGFMTLGIVFTLGVSVETVLSYQVATVIHNALRHGNIALPPRLDAMLRRVLVTPDVHRIHHSSIECETNSNYGVMLTCWDRWFGTYRAQPAGGHDGMTLGLEYFRGPGENALVPMLTQPLRQRAARARHSAASVTDGIGETEGAAVTAGDR